MMKPPSGYYNLAKDRRVKKVDRVSLIGDKTKDYEIAFREVINPRLTPLQTLGEENS